VSQVIEKLLRVLRGSTMSQEEMEDRVEVLESKVRANTLAITRHEDNAGMHVKPNIEP